MTKLEIMRKSTLLFIYLLVSISFGFSQNLEDQPSKIREIYAKEGALVTKTKISIGTVKQLDFQIVYAKDLTNGIAINGIELQGQSFATAYIDADEVDNIIKALNYLIEIKLNFVTNQSEEFVYQSKDGFAIQALWMGASMNYAIHLGGKKGNLIPLEIVEMQKLLALFEEAKTKLK